MRFPLPEAVLPKSADIFGSGWDIPFNIEEIFFRIHLYSTTGNTVPACFGASRPASNPATSQSAASV